MISFKALLLWTTVCLALGTPTRDTADVVRRQTSPSASCSYVPAPPNGPSQVCGKTGTLSKPSKLGKAQQVGSLAGCTNLCVDKATCISYGYTASNSQCQLYRKYIINQGFKPSTTAKTAFYNRSCFTKACDTPPPDLSCNNQGIQYAPYPLNQSTNLSILDPKIYKSMSPYYAGTYGGIGGFFGNNNGNGSITIYGSSQSFNANQFVVSHRGYFYALVTGIHQFAILDADNLVEFWVGPNAYSGWNRSNELFEDSDPNPPAATNVTLTAGHYYPFRVLVANTGGSYSFSYAINGPNSKDGTDSGSDTSNQLVQFSCDGTTAPHFPPFGAET